jgi:hypothetical protein
MDCSRQPPSANLASEEDRNLHAQREIKRQAQSFEQARAEKSAEANALMHQHHRFAEPVALLQVGIASGGAAAPTRKRPAWWVSLAPGLVGTVMFASALIGSH